jgi:hypothetical protein
MHEMYTAPGEVIQRVELLLPGAPVELINPVIYEMTEPIYLGAL